MLSRKNRFSRHNFNFLRKHMKSFKTEGFLFLYSPSNQFEPRFAAVISKKVDKKAVARNWFRRGVYEMFNTYFLKDQLRFNVICLYKGQTIPENKQDLELAVKKLAHYLSQKN